MESGSKYKRIVKQGIYIDEPSASKPGKLYHVYGTLTAIAPPVTVPLAIGRADSLPRPRRPERPTNPAASSAMIANTRLPFVMPTFGSNTKPARTVPVTEPMVFAM